MAKQSKPAKPATPPPSKPESGFPKSIVTRNDKGNKPPKVNK